ncbi:MAG: FolC bifunctional protein, partial [Thermomicrobiales bacterium]|nr:FolC bifunctional protein [Thermomicrobiales bacterium]
HQLENACTALAALHSLNAAGFEIPELACRRGLALAHWPGRFERLAARGREIVLDAAHTPAAAAALVETWRDAKLPPNATVILGMGADKTPRAFLEAIRPIVGYLIATRADSPRAAVPEAIAAIAAELGVPHETQPSVAEALAAAASTTPAPLLITGSLFVAGEGREALGLAQPDLVWRALNEAHLSPRAAPRRT